ncbi:MAG TPA: hypothetical protein PLB30_04985 [Thermoleophilia bacterium]|nr:hypothetical protein [Thermoleophilia bacterium]HQG04345.1 hypothetical protein [Thermoleophilia bacterium]HQG54870.1 hypothetical protein [Thermoleophilia bacterium]HQJ97889.1 hypothetical protein [Thermoleophilia bacterium]
MVSEIARRLEPETLEQIKALESETGLTLVAFACRSLDPAREERLRAIQAELGPILTAEPAQPSAEQLARIRELESALDLSLVAVRAQGSG